MTVETKKCKFCGASFVRPRGRKGNNVKYCHNCRERAYYLAKKRANQKYKAKHKTTKIKIVKCNFCGNPFVSVHNKRYCSDECKKESYIMKNRKSTRDYKLKWGLSDKERYFNYLGNSNLSAHKSDDFKKEFKKILQEKKRLGL